MTIATHASDFQSLGRRSILKGALATPFAALFGGAAIASAVSEPVVERTGIYPTVNLLVATHHSDLGHMPAGTPMVYKATERVYCDNHYITHDGELVTMQMRGVGMTGVHSYGSGWREVPKDEAHRMVAWSLVDTRAGDQFSAYLRYVKGL